MLQSKATPRSITLTDDAPRRARRAAARGRESQALASRWTTGRIRAQVSELSATSVAARVALDVLRRLDQFGPLTVAEIPRAWPVTRQHVRSTLRWLAAEGLVAVVADTAGLARRFQLTSDGRRVFDEIDWTQAVEEMEGEGEL